LVPASITGTSITVSVPAADFTTKPTAGHVGVAVVGPGGSTTATVNLTIT
jgi:hypothetical protein